MLLRSTWLALLTFVLVVHAGAQPQRRMAVTVDDLPGNVASRCDTRAFLDFTHRLTQGLTEHRISATGFVNESIICRDFEPERLAEVLSVWLDTGHDLGNHTFTHRAFHAGPNGQPDPTLAEYKVEVLRGEAVTRPLMATRGVAPRYFRHPYLRSGPDDARKAAFEAFLADHGYTVAPVTIDNSEWVYALA